MTKNKEFKNTLLGLAFLSPNILGFSIFTIFPLGFSLMMAFSNWDLSQHNIFQSNPIHWVFFDNFSALLSSNEFWKFFKNTLFFMLGIPVSIAGSLMAAILLNQDLKAPSKKIRNQLILGSLLILGIILTIMTGLKASVISIFLSSIFTLILMGGLLGGSTLYRTLFYTPHFTAGVATFILWKKLYNPQSGPLTNFLQPVLDHVSIFIESVGSENIGFLKYAAATLCFLSLSYGLKTILKMRKELELGNGSFAIAYFLSALPSYFIVKWSPDNPVSAVLQIILIGTLFYYFASFIKISKPKIPIDDGIGKAIWIGFISMTAQFILIGLCNLFQNIPAIMQSPLSTPNWLTDYNWAKPSLMFMGFWASIGSNQMLLYLAALSNLSPELQEAAEIDGASKFQKFWNVTWPQLAPVTFFISIMAVIQGMQGGFEVAKTMTGGGPAGATTTLEYYIYDEGFASGRLAYASAISWVLFAMIFLLTLFNWRFGNRFIDE